MLAVRVKVTDDIGALRQRKVDAGFEGGPLAEITDGDDGTC